jgi:L-ascorbate metabolism protein UlaG (beta-lactamase superfamily)
MIRTMIQPLLSGEALLADIQAANQTADDGFRLWWLGQSGYLLQWRGVHVLIDPYLSDSLTAKYADTDKPHIRMTACPVEPSALSFIDVATSSHNHTDHLDAATLGPLREANPGLRLIIPEANRAFVAERLQLSDASWPLGMEENSERELMGIRYHAVASAHETVERDASGRARFLGYVMQFGRWCVYHSGDCVPWDGLAEQLQRFSIDVMLLPINGRSPERRVAGNFTGPEAAQLAQAVKARLVIPCHYEMFTFNTVTPDEFVEECRRRGQPYRLLRCGERWSSSELDQRATAP